MTVLAGADVVLPDRVLSPGAVVFDGGRIVEIVDGRHPPGGPGERIDLAGHLVVPGFVDVHVHGVAGVDAMAGPDAVAAMARVLTRFGVVAFCPTTIACTPAALRSTLEAVSRARAAPAPGEARVLPAHLESNFVSYECRGAQPGACLRMPPGPAAGWRPPADGGSAGDTDFSGDDVLAEITRAREHVGIVTLAPELPGGLALVDALIAAGHRVSLGHSDADFESASAAIDRGARQATHLFNRMGRQPAARAPGLAGVVLTRPEVDAEIICDGVHVHPAMIRLALAAKHASGVMAITDGTAGAALPSGSRTVLGGRTIVAADAAYLDDGTLAGSTATMDRVFRVLVEQAGLSPVDAATICATTPARAMGLEDAGTIVAGARADLVVLDRTLRVVRTYVAGVTRS